MTYTPGLNGGRINATISGNTAGAGALMSTGTITLAGGNNITLSQAGNAITISGGNANQTLGLYGLGNTTQNSSTTLDARSLSFNGLGAATVGYSNGSIQISAPTQTVQTQNMVSIQGSTNNISFGNANNITFGGNASTITASYSQSNQNISLYGLGNTTQNSSTVLNASNLSFNGLGNVSVGYSNGSIQISGAGGGAAGTNTFGISNLGNTSGTSGTINGTNAQLLFAGGDNVTLSQSVNGSSATITISAANQTVQTQNMVSIQGSTNDISFGNANNITFGGNASTITASYSQSNQNISLYGLGNTTQNSSTVLNASNLSFNGLGGATVGYSNGSIQISGAQTVAQSNQSVGLYALGNTTQNSSTTLDARSLSFNGLGNVSVGYSNGSIQISGSGGGAADGYNSAEFAGSTANSTMPILWAGNTNGSGNITLGLTGSTVTGSAPSGGGGVALANSQTTYSSGTLNLLEGGGAVTIASSAGGQSFKISVPATSSLSATGAVSISTNGSTISIGVPIMSHSIGMNTSTAGGGTGGTSGHASGDDFRYDFYAGSNITLSQSVNGGSGSLSIYGPNAGGGVTLESYEPRPIQHTGTAVLSVNINTSGSVSLVPFDVVQNAAAGYIQFMNSMSFITGGNSSFRQSGYMIYGLYTRGTGTNSTTLGSITTGSWGYSLTYNNSSMTFSHPTISSVSGHGYGTTSSGGFNISSAYTGLKLVRVPLNTTLSAGNYWLAMYGRASFSSFSSGLRLSFFGNAHGLVTGLAPMGSYSSAFTGGTNLVSGMGNWMVGMGLYAPAGNTTLPDTVSLSSMTQNANMSVIPYFKFAAS